MGNKRLFRILEVKVLSIYIIFALLFTIALIMACQNYENTSTLNKYLSTNDYKNPPIEQWEEDFINSNGLPEAPVAKYITAEDGLQLAFREWIPENWDGKGDMVLIVPQWDLHSAHYALLGKILSENNVLARVIDIRGTGLSVCKSANDCSDKAYTPRVYYDSYDYYLGKVGDCPNRQQLGRDLNLHVTDMQSNFPNASLNIVGHTNGVGILIRLIESIGMSTIKSAIFLSPFYHYEQPQIGTKKIDADKGNEIPYNFDMLSYDPKLGAIGDAMRNIEDTGGHRYALKNLIKPFDDLQTVYFSYNFMESGLATAPYGFWDAFTKPLLWINPKKQTGYDIDKAKIEYMQAPTAKENHFLIIDNVTRYGLIWSKPLAETLVLWVKNPNTFNM